MCACALLVYILRMEHVFTKGRPRPKTVLKGKEVEGVAVDDAVR